MDEVFNYVIQFHTFIMGYKDFITAMFECGGSVAVSVCIRKLHIDKMVRGVDWKYLAYYMTWTGWNLLYYPSFDQWYSFSATCSMLLVNSIWMTQMIYYNARERRGAVSKV
jgi:hypothetical protein